MTNTERLIDLPSVMPAAMPLHKALRQRQEEILGMTNPELARRLGYPRPNVIAMMMNGSMKVPPAKVPALAVALQLEPLWLLRRVCEEQMPELWAVIDRAVGPDRLVTASEHVLITEIRAGLLGEHSDLTQDELFMTGLHMLVAEAVERSCRSVVATRAGDRRPAHSGWSQERRELTELLRRQATERRALRERWSGRRSTVKESA